MVSNRQALWVALVGALLLVVAVSGCERVRGRLIDMAADRAVAGDNRDWLDDGAMHVILCGTGSPLPDPDRAAACTAVIAGGRLFLVDSGPGSWENVQLWGLPRAELSAVLLTHFHSDHIGELGEVIVQSWLGGRSRPLIVYGPPGVERVVGGFQEAYALDAHYRISHHGREVLPVEGARAIPRPLRMPPGQSSMLVMDDGKVRVTAFVVDHEPVSPAYGYRFDAGGRSVVISGDTAVSENLVRSASGADLLVHEALAAHLVEPLSQAIGERGDKRLARMTSDILDYHATPGQAVDAASGAGVDTLVLSHIVPPPARPIVRRMIMRGAKGDWGGNLILGNDGMHFRLPVDSDEISREDLN
ncbi:MAG: MBL fold metallo-hydrolase [Deltaproteobacteria bacterium]